ncbi:hypothetical protein M426DRAFT_323652, partial [Hypoxylon sp. CI-4A]
MKLQSFNFLLPALAGITGASAEGLLQRAEAYLIRQTKPASLIPPPIPNEVARAIVLQRLSTPEQPSNFGPLPETVCEYKAVSYVNEFGKTTRPLFEDDSDANEPNQLVIAFTGVTSNNHKNFKAALSSSYIPLAFTAPGLSQIPFKGKKSKCAFEQSIDPSNSKCWKGTTQYLELDAGKDKNVVAKLGKNLESLNAQALAGTLETTILLLADPSISSEDKLRRRDFELNELVIAEDIPTADSTFNSDGSRVEPNPDKPFHAFGSSSPSSTSTSSETTSLARGPVVFPACYASHNECATATDGCSGRGQCIDKWEKLDTAKACFFCRCMATEAKDAKGNSGVYHWGGGACQKRDISTPFWLFAGTAIALFATVAFAIGLLFSVGEEKLPGVIGAGVSRSGS